MTHPSNPGQWPARTPLPSIATAGQRFETTVLVFILLTVGGFAGAASFTHVHDWTMTNSPPATGSWFGWANAVVSELVPIAALLVMRRRRRAGQPVAYPATLLVLAIGLSVTAQLAVARPTLSGGVVSVVPALAFAALAKLVLGKAPTDTKPATATGRPSVDTSTPPRPMTVPATVPARSMAAVDGMQDRSAVPESLVDTIPEPETITDALMSHARKAAVAVLKDTGRPITRDELRARLRIRAETASEILRRIRDTENTTNEPYGGESAEAGAHSGIRATARLIGTVTR